MNSPFGFVLRACAAFLLCATSATASTVTVDNAGDVVGLGNAAQCAPGNIGTCTLRDALSTATEGDAITFDPSIATVTLTSHQSLIAPATPDAIPIRLDGAYRVVIDGDGTPNSILSIPNLRVMAVRGITLQNAHPQVSGGALDVRGTLILDGSLIQNAASAVGAMVVYNGGTATVTASSFNSNATSSAFIGGAAIELFSGATVTVANATFYGNHSALGGAAISSAGTLTLINSTFSSNTASTSANAIFSSGGTATLSNTIVDIGAAGGALCAGTFADGGGNIASDATCGLTASSSHPNTPAQLGALQYNGGPLQTLLPAASSAAVDGGVDAKCAAAPVNNIDQRGVGRPFGTHCDSGAVEAQPLSILVDSDADSATANPANCGGTPRGTCRFRDAVALAVGGESIGFDPSIGTILVTGRINFTDSSGIAITVNGDHHVTLDGGGTTQLLSVQTQANVALHGLTLQHAHGAFDLGIVVDNRNVLSIDECNILDNIAVNQKGVIHSQGPTLNVTRSLFVRNGNNGTIYAQHGAVSVSDSTFAFNTSFFGGTGVLLEGDTLTVRNSTFVGNSCTSPGCAVLAFTASPVIDNSIFLANSYQGTTFAGGTVYGGASNNNLYWGNLNNGVPEDACGGCTATGDIAANPHLSSLGGYGGSTATFVPMAGSAAIDTADDALSTAADQRGVTRPQGAHADIGAVERRAQEDLIFSSGLEF